VAPASSINASASARPTSSKRRVASERGAELGADVLRHAVHLVLVTGVGGIGANRLADFDFADRKFLEARGRLRGEAGDREERGEGSGDNSGEAHGRKDLVEMTGPEDQRTPGKMSFDVFFVSIREKLSESILPMPSRTLTCASVSLAPFLSSLMKAVASFQRA